MLFRSDALQRALNDPTLVAELAIFDREPELRRFPREQIHQLCAWLNHDKMDPEILAAKSDLETAIHKVL